MDPVTAIANLVTEITKLAIAMMDGQTPEQKQKLWDWYIADMERWRKLFHIA